MNIYCHTKCSLTQLRVSNYIRNDLSLLSGSCLRTVSHKNSSHLALYFSKIWRLVGGITADTEVALRHLICAV